MNRGAEVANEEIWRQKVLDKLDRIIALLEGWAAAGPRYPGSYVLPAVGGLPTDEKGDVNEPS